ncbi:patatin-like phospholipase family protein [Pontibacter sp. Tf4]|uniref:patatin-like phospholipase family protein n=1 Tax=Pontibacter sp. Tf4 TaxID=2761620 RepID=UPI0016247C04|nr:patatin-like phospholipase family protein [Pontibacter sp. Tf4]MBB6609992.1 patatin-like phospholipase family protein [Pontibacter sp. Tf4]
MKRILSIDGGGIRGIIPGQVLVALEEKLQHRSGNSDARLADYFDFFAGTSTGGILTCISLCPSELDPTKARFSAQEAVDLYVHYGKDIFDVTLWQQLQSGFGTFDEKYNASALEELLERYFGELRLSQLLKPCLIPAYDTERRAAHFFAQHDSNKLGAGADFLVRDVCRATSAAPTYFETAMVRSCSGVPYSLVDGGVFANNPALCAYSEVRNAMGNPSAKDMFLVSLGTGSMHTPYDYTEAKDWGAIGWIRPVIDIMMAGASETTDYHLSKMFSAGGNEANYVRIQPAWMGNASLDMDNATAANIQALVEVGVETAQNCAAELDRIVDVLLAGTDPVEYEVLQQTTAAG